MNKKIQVALMCLLAGSLSAQNLLRNGDFSDPNGYPWIYCGEKNSESMDIEEGVCRLPFSATATKHFHVLLMHKEIQSVESFTTYELSFDAKTDSTPGKGVRMRFADVNVYEANKHFGLQKDILVAADWEHHSYIFTTPEIPADSTTVLKFLLGNMDGDIFLRNVVLKKVNPSVG